MTKRQHAQTFELDALDNPKDKLNPTLVINVKSKKIRTEFKAFAQIKESKRQKFDSVRDERTQLAHDVLKYQTAGLEKYREMTEEKSNACRKRTGVSGTGPPKEEKLKLALEKIKEAKMKKEERAEERRKRAGNGAKGGEIEEREKKKVEAARQKEEAEKRKAEAAKKKRETVKRVRKAKKMSFEDDSFEEPKRKKIKE